MVVTYNIRQEEDHNKLLRYPIILAKVLLIQTSIHVTVFHNQDTIHITMIVYVIWPDCFNPLDCNLSGIIDMIFNNRKSIDVHGNY